jgi:hypothetical protein
LGDAVKALSLGVSGGLIGAGAMWLWQNGRLRLAPLGMTYAELAATLLGAVSVLLAILGLFLAAIAILGFAQFRGLVRKSATATARDHINERLDGGDLQAHFEKMATRFLEAQFKAGTLRNLVEARVDHVIFAGAGERAKRQRDDDGDDRLVE